MESSSATAQTHAFFQFLNISTWLVSVATNILYSTVLHPTTRHVSDKHLTPFTTNSLFTACFWMLLYVLQLGFLSTHWSRDLRETTVKKVYSSFALFNLLQFGWVLLWVHHHFVVSELFLIFNFLNILQLYIRLGYKLAPLERTGWRRLILLEAPTARLPLAVLFIDILHNGAVAFHVHGGLGRLLSNIFIWIIFVVGGLVVVWFRDWVFGLALAYHTLSLAIEQLSIKIIALQWIFAFVISGVIALLSVMVMIPGMRRTVESVSADTQARVDSAVDETSRLLSGEHA